MGEPYIAGKSKNYRINYAVLMAEIQAYKEKLWERSTFCECGAACLNECECDVEKRERYMRRENSKINKKFRDRLNQALLGKFAGVREKTTGDDSQ